MFDTVRSILAGFTGQLKGSGEARKMVWMLVLAFLAGWLCVVFAGWISYPSYRSAISYLPYADQVAVFFTAGIAGFLYFSLSYVSGFAVERWRGTIMKYRDYKVLGARIFGIASVLFLVVDMYMNYQGTTYRAKEQAGSVATFEYQTPEARRSEIERDRKTLDQLLSGQLGGYGWRDPRTKIYHLNSSGKKYQRKLSGNIERLQIADNVDRSASVQNVENLNGERSEIERLASAGLKNMVYGVYVLMLIICVSQAYIVEGIQETLGASKTVKNGTAVTAEAGFTVPNPPSKSAQNGPRTVSERSTNVPNVSIPLTVPPSAPLPPTVPGKGYPIICKQCGVKAVKRSPRAKYCSDKCRRQFHLDAAK